MHFLPGQTAGTQRASEQFERMNQGPGPWRWMTDERVTYWLKVVMLLVLAFYAGEYVVAFLERIRGVVYVLIGAIFFAYLIYPAVDWLRKRMPLGAALALIYIVFILTVIVVGWFVLPRIFDEVGTLVHRYPELAARYDRLVNDPNDPITSRLPDPVRREIAHVPSQMVAWLQRSGFQTFGHVVSVLAGFFLIVATFVIIPLVTVYLYLDLDNLKRSLATVIPDDRWRSTVSFLSEVDQVIGGFIRGQLLVAITVGTLITVAMFLLHVPYPFILGLIAAIGDLVPYVGAVVAYFPAAISALINNGWLTAVFVTVAFVAIYEAEGHFIAPNIVSRTVKLSPFAVLVAVLVGGELGGIFGALVAIPVLGVLRVIALRVFVRREANEPQP